MAIAKVQYKENASATPEVWMDTTQKTVTSGTMLSGTTALKNDGTGITGDIASKSSSDLTASGATVTAPAGYYPSSASKSVASGSATTPSTSITANPSISVSSDGLITATTSATKSVTPAVSAGYVSSGSAGTITVSGSNTEQLTTQAAQTLYPSTTDQTISSGKYLTGTQTVKGVLLTNLDAGNIKKDVVVKVGDSTDDDRITSVTGTYEGSGGYSEALIKSFIQRDTSFTSFDFPSGTTKIGDYAFAMCSQLQLASLPNTITTIGNYAFSYCYSMTLPSLPAGITSIGESAFDNCSSITLSSLPSSITSISSYAFRGCSSITLSSLPSGITKINSGIFMNCQNITLSELPSGVTSIGVQAFMYCCRIPSIYCVGAITSFGANCFIGSSNLPMTLTSARFPNMALTSNFPVSFGATTSANACRLLEIVDIGSTTGIAANAFANCNALQTLILRKTSAVCSLANVSAFTNTPMRGYNSLTGTVYVPNDLIASYRSATNWSTLYNDGTVNFVKIEDSIYDLS